MFEWLLGLNKLTLIVATLSKQVESLLQENKRLVKMVDELNARTKRLVRRVGPGSMLVSVYGENHVDQTLKFKVVLPEKSAPDVVKRELAVSINGERMVFPLDGSAMELDGLAGPQDAQVALSLVDIDDAGNRSEASVVDGIVLKDTFAPPMPGFLGMVITGEEFSEPPVEEPPVEDPPADEPPADEPPADEPPADEPPADEPPADEPPADEPPVEEPPVEDPPSEDPIDDGGIIPDDRT